MCPVLYEINETKKSSDAVRVEVAKPPEGRHKWQWYGPAFIWMVAAIGSGEILFSPRVGSRYGYEFLWAAILMTYFMWTMIREIGRYTVVTGQSILEGYRQLPGPRNWPIWIIFVPQLFVSAITIGGIAALGGNMLRMVAGGNQMFYAGAFLAVSVFLVGLGKYTYVQRVTTLFAAILILSALVTAGRVFPSADKILSGFAPTLPQDFDPYFVLPWFGFYLAGGAGIMLFSYWVQAKGYAERLPEKDDLPILEEKGSRIRGLKEWIRIMSTTAAIGVCGGSFIIIAFLVLGAELLGPQGIVPEGIKVAEDLTKLLSTVWGNFGYWLLSVTFIVALWGTVISNQDGWPRMFTDATYLLREKTAEKDREKIRNFYLIGFCTVIPLIIVLLVRDPVKILSPAGIITAIHTPFVIGLTVWVNRRRLPSELRPGRWTVLSMFIAGTFYFVFGVLYLLNMAGIKWLQ